MRSGIWILTVATVVGLAWVADAADDWATDRNTTETSASKKRIHYFSRGSETEAPKQRTVAQADTRSPIASPRRYTRSRSSAKNRKSSTSPLVKNYSELFKNRRTNTINRTNAVKQASGSVPKTSTVRHANHQDAAGAVSPSKIKQTSGKSRVVNARFQVPKGISRKGQIQRARAESEAKGSVEVLGGPAAASVAPKTTVTAKHTIQQSAAPSVSVKWAMLGGLNVGQECTCVLTVKNDSQADASDVVIEAAFPLSIRLLSADPEPSESVERLIWKLESLAAGEQKEITVKMIPSVPGELSTSATVQYTANSAAVFQVDEPQIVVVIKGPSEAIVGDPVSSLITVTNPGTGVARDVVVEAILPEGLEHPKGKRMAIGVGSLAAGETRSIRLAMSAISGGEQIILVEAKGAANLKHRAAAKVNVIAPSLEVALKGPSLRFVNRNAKYTVTVANSGAAASNNVRVYQEIPDGYNFLSAGNGGKVDSQKRSVTWYVGRLEAGESVNLALKLSAKEVGQYEHLVRVTADQGIDQETTLSTKIDGSAALVMVIDDLDDPVEVGGKTFFDIRIKNRGSKAATKIGLAVELPGGVQLISAEGPTEYISENGLLVFKSLGELTPGEEVLYKLRITGDKPGNLRFRARMTSDSIQQPLIVEELKRFYED